MKKEKESQEKLPTTRGNPLTRHQRDNLPLARVAAYQYNGDQAVSETTWPQVWMRRVREKFELRRSEAQRNLVLNGLLLELLNAAKQVNDRAIFWFLLVKFYLELFRN